MSVRAVVLPATPLLVPGAAGSGRPLVATRRAVLDALAGVAPADARRGTRWGVLAPAHRTRFGARRASLGPAGVADRWVPSLPTDDDGPAAGVPASVALWALNVVAGPGAVRDATVAELGGADDARAQQSRAIERLAGLDGIVVAGGSPGRPDLGTTGLAPGPGAVLDALARRGGWQRSVTRVPEVGDHLPGGYDVVTWSDAHRPANQPTPANSSAKRAVRPTSTTGT